MVAGYGLPMINYSRLGVLSDYAGGLLIMAQVSLGAPRRISVLLSDCPSDQRMWASLNRAWTPYLFRRLNSNRTLAFSHIMRGIAFPALRTPWDLSLSWWPEPGVWELFFPPCPLGSNCSIYSCWDP
jgi:hypothetical protein